MLKKIKICFLATVCALMLVAPVSVYAIDYPTLPDVAVTRPYYLTIYYERPNTDTFFMYQIFESDTPFVYYESGTASVSKMIANTAGNRFSVKTYYYHLRGSGVWEFSSDEDNASYRINRGDGYHELYTNHDVKHRDTGDIVFQGPLPTEQGMLKADWWTVIWTLITSNAKVIVVGVLSIVSLIFLVASLITYFRRLKKSSI